MATYRIGTCSWRYPSWGGLIYDEADERGLLAQYADRYTTVEVDRWFWSLFGPKNLQLPHRVDVEAYGASVPESFRFAVKIPDALTLTHHRAKSRNAALLPNEWFLDTGLFHRFWECVAPLHGVLGPLIFQFEYLNRQKMCDLDTFMSRLGDFAVQLPKGPIYALETRNRHFIRQGLFDFLKTIGWVPALISGYWMPSPLDVYDLFEETLLQFPAIILRLLGPDRARIEHLTGKQWDRIVAPRDAELRGLAEMVLRLARAGVTPWIYVNNHYEGSAPLTIDRLQSLLANLVTPSS